MDPVQIGRLKEEHLKGLRLCEEKISQWEKFKSDYESLEKRLETLPHQLSYDITVPFGSNAFTKGQLVHTNEILVLLGDDWFAEMSAKQAEALARRRKDKCDKMLSDLEKEKEQYKNWLNYIEEVSNKEDLVEIVEKYDEEEEKKWREKHRENLLAQRRQMAAVRDLSGSSLTSEDEDHVILEQMDELELNESSVSDDGGHSEGEEKSTGLKITIPSNNRESSSVDSDVCRSLDSVGSPGSVKHVRWMDLTKQNVTRITFKHSRKNKNGNCPHKLKHQDSSENEEHPVIQSPSDIYEQFGSFFPASPPKGILKVRNSPPSNEVPMDFAIVESPLEECPAFTGEVHEGSSDPVPIPEKKSSRPSSHFKSSRKNKRR